VFRYTVTEEDYVKMARWMLLKRRGTGAVPIIRLLFSTVGQMGIVLWLMLRYPELEGWLRIAICIMSLLWAGLGVFRFFFLNLRARLLLNQAKKQNASSDFWKEHHLSLRDKNILVSYGRSSGKLACRDLTRVEHFEGLALLLQGTNVFEPVPESVVRSEKWKKFEEELLELARAEREEEHAGIIRDLGERGSFSAFVRLSPEEVADSLTVMRRKSLAFRAGWSPLAAFNLIFPFVLAAYAVLSSEWGLLPLSLAALVLFNLPTLWIFTPLYRRQVLSRVLPAGPEGYFLALCDKSLHLATRDHIMKYSLSELKKILTYREEIFLIFSRQNMVFIPESCADAFIEAMKKKKQQT